MAQEIPRCPSCGREFAAFVPGRRWVCVYCGTHAAFGGPVAENRPLPRRAALGIEQDAPYVSWQQQRFTPAESLALLRLKLDRERLLHGECGRLVAEAEGEQAAD